MMTHENRQSRMFRSIVLMGSSLALGCAGKAALGGADGSAGNAGSAASAAGDGAGGTSGSPQISLGGAIGAGAPSFGGAVGAGASSFGGASMGGAASTTGAAGAPDCPPAQWTCSAPLDCDYQTGWVPDACKCDPSRPSQASDCKVGQSFVCMSTGEPAANSRQGLQCSCVSSPGYCSQACVSAFGNQSGSYVCDDQSQPGTVLCGCAVILLK